MNAITKPLLTAAKAYAACRIEVARMMAELKKELDKNAAKAHAHRMNVIRIGLDKHATKAHAHRMNVIRMRLDKHAAKARADRMNVIQMGLDKQDAAHIADSKNWGHVASLRQFQSELFNLIRFVSDLDPKTSSPS